MSPKGALAQPKNKSHQSLNQEDEEDSGEGADAETEAVPQVKRFMRRTGV